MVKFKVEFTCDDNTFNIAIQDDSFNLTMLEEECRFEVQFGIVNTVTSDSIDIYDGKSTVIPAAHTSQILYTANKMLTKDITVAKVPFYEVSNVTGDTVFIASEV